MIEKGSLEANLDFCFDSNEKAQQALLALQPDLNQKHEKRSHTVLKTNKKVLSAHISAVDPNALLASIQNMFKSIALFSKISSLERK